jgi:copper chaperone CopZ
MKTVTYDVPAINCIHCVHTITTELSELPGVKEVQADLATKKVSIEFEAPASEEKIEALLTEINYPPQK